jgi:hypothetical protein
LTGFTYAQILCCGAQQNSQARKTPTYKKEPPKLLISLDLDFCFFCEQFKQALDFQGLPACQSKLSTKLSTETLGRSGSHVKSMTYIAFPH